MAIITASASGGTRNWSDTASWVGGVKPTAADDVLFTAVSGNITIDGTSGSPSLARSVDCTGYTGTWSQTFSTFLNIGDGSGGSLKLVPGMAYVPNASGAIQFLSTTTGNLVTSAGKTLGNLIFNGAGGGWTFQDNLALNSGSDLTLTAGTLDVNGKNITSGRNIISTGAATRALTLGASTITLNGSASNSQWNLTSTGMTLSAASATINLNAATSTFTGAGLTYGTVAMGSSTAAIQGANSYTTLSVTANLTCTIDSNQTVSGTFTYNGAGATTTRGLLSSSVRGTSHTISAGTVTVTNIDIRDITGAGGGNWDIHACTGLAGDCGGNSGITFTTQQTNFWFKDTGNFSTTANWFLATGGTGGAGRVPLPQDTARFDGSSFSAGSKTVTRDISRCGSIDFTGSTNTPAFASGAGTWECYGSIKLISGMTHTGTGGMTFCGRSAFTFDGGTLTWPTSSTITINATGGTLTLASNLASNSTLTVTDGTFATSTFTSSFTTYTQTGGTLTINTDMTLTGATIVSGGSSSGTAKITGGTTFAGSGAGTSWNASFSGTSISSMTTGNFTFPTLTLSSSFATGASFSGTITIGSGGMTCTTFSLAGTGASGSFVGGSGLINCSSTFTSNSNATVSMTVGTGGLQCTTCTLGSGASHPSFITVSGATITLTSTGTVWNCTGSPTITFDSNSTIVISDTSATSKTFAGNAKTYGNLTLTGHNIIITGANTFNVIALNNTNDSTGITFPASTTTTVTDLTSTGFASNLAKIISSSGGVAATINSSSPVDIDYISVKDSTAAGSTPFYAGTHSTNVSGNTSWTFTDRPPNNTSLASTEENDTLSGTSAVKLTASAAATESDDTLSSTAKVKLITSFVATEADDTLSGLVRPIATGTLSRTEDDDTLSAVELVRITVSMATTEDEDNLSASSFVKLTAVGNLTEDDDTLSAPAAVLLRSSFIATEEEDAITGNIHPIATGILARTEDDDTLTAAGAVLVTSSMATTEIDDTLNASATVKDSSKAADDAGSIQLSQSDSLHAFIASQDQVILTISEQASIRIINPVSVPDSVNIIIGDIAAVRITEPTRWFGRQALYDIQNEEPGIYGAFPDALGLFNVEVAMLGEFDYNAEAFALYDTVNQRSVVIL